jgi:predicted dehydrogenase/molybdenum cofactor biosynthesis enzyme MoaA
LSGAQQRSVELYVGGGCDQSGALCDCREAPTTPDRVDKELSGGGGRLTLRGGTADRGRLEAMVRRGREAGFGEIAFVTHGLAFEKPEDATRLARLGADVAIVPLFSQHAPVHDRIAGQPRGLVRTLVGMRALADAGMGIEVEVPLLPAKLQSASELLELARRAVPTLRAARIYLPRVTGKGPLSPPSWTDGAPALAAALGTAKALGVKLPLRRLDLVPLCALRGHPEHHGSYSFNPKKSLAPPGGSAYVAACDGCKVRGQCPGVSASYFDAHGEAGIQRYEQRPSAMYEQRTTPGRKWDERQRKAARDSRMLVLRPTVNCNQDCTFCSANETSGNVWSDREEMIRRIVRAGRRGINWLSFSGGDPTLSKDLLAYVRTASRMRIENVELITNAVLLDSEPKVRELRRAGLTHAFVSLHAHAEDLSRHLTQKIGDWARTVRGVELLVEAGVTVTLNHVISARNYRFLKPFVDFVHERFRNRVEISFAFVTPQYKALENIDLVPRLSDVWPHLRVALHRALELGQGFVIGARQGIPPCFLKEFQGWSDARMRAHELMGEDAPQKIRGPRCGECAYSEICPGVWRPYAARYGLDELVPVVREKRFQPVTDQPFRRSFTQVPPELRDLEGEERGLAEAEAAILAQAKAAPDSLRLPVFAPVRTRPLRLAMFGTGRQARRLAKAVSQVRGLSLDAVASPHAPVDSGPEFGHCPSYRDAKEALADMRPDAVVIAAATHAHFELAKACLEAGVPALVEKPFARSAEEATELIQLARDKGVVLMPGHNVLFGEGLDRLFAVQGPRGLAYQRHTTAGSPDAPRTWNRSQLAETLYHAVALVTHAMGGGTASVQDAFVRGDSAPERLKARLVFPTGEAELNFDFTASGDSLAITTTTDRGEVAWRRVGREASLVEYGRNVPLERRGNDLELMLGAFAAAVLGQSQVPVTPDEALCVMQTNRALLDALAAAGAAFERPNAPKHVQSRALGNATR